VNGRVFINKKNGGPQNVTVLQVKSIIKVQALARRHAVLKLLATNLEKRRLITKVLDPISCARRKLI